MRLEALYDAPGLPTFDLPVELADAYDGNLGIGRPRLVANFVATIDGVVAIPDLPQSNKLISQESASDRFVMALLRAVTDAVLVGSGTLRASPRGLWTAEQAYPDAAPAFAELRSRLDLPPVPERVVVTGSGELPDSHPVFEAGALVLTTESGAARLSGRLPDATTVVAVGEGDAVDPTAAIGALRERGHGLVLSEAGPHLFGSLVEGGLVDELFLTVSPLLAGRDEAQRDLGLVEGSAFLPGTPQLGRLLSVRRDESHLFLRYELDSRASPIARRRC